VIDELPYRPGDTPPRGAGRDAAPGSRPDRADLVRGLRELGEEVADRVPVPLRAVRTVRPALPAVPWRAAAAALVIAVVVGTAMLTRARGGDAEEIGPVTGTRTTMRSAVGEVPKAATRAPALSGPSGGSGASGASGPSRTVSLAGPPGGGPTGVVVPGTARVVVHVSGHVRRPGLVRLPAGSRVWDAVAAAGGPARGARLDRLNLARPLVDGEKLTVPDADDPLTVAPGPAEAASAVPGGARAGPGGETSGAVIDLNGATLADLDTLPGVGPVLAGRIMAWRTQHGRFTRVEELGEVTGIGDKLLAQLTPLVRV
jgi:competence protein ComEA